MKLAAGMKLIAEGWVTKPKGFRVRFEQLIDGKLATGYSPPLDDALLDSDVTAWRYAWKLAMATGPKEEHLQEGDLVNVTVVDDQNEPVIYYAQGIKTVFNEAGVK